MKNTYQKQFDYELWANQLAIKSIKESNQPDERVFKLISHVVASHSIWLSRIKDDKPDIGGWDLMTLDECLERSKSNHNNFTQYINSASQEELERHIHFKLYDKESTITIGDMMIHLINHSSYHRGQIIAGLKGKLEPLPLTTYIVYAKSNLQLL